MLVAHSLEPDDDGRAVACDMFTFGHLLGGLRFKQFSMIRPVSGGPDLDGIAVLIVRPAEADDLQ